MATLPTLPTQPKLPTMPYLPVMPQQPVQPNLPQAVVKPYGYPYITPKSHFVNYNDPAQINSLADVILGTANPYMKRTTDWGIEDIPILNIIPGAVQLYQTTVWEPLKAGDYTAILYNTLMDVGETMNIPSNAFKGLLM